MQLRKQSQLFTAITTLLLTTPLWATNGYFTHGVGTKNKALAGAGLAMSEGAISIANNPAAGLANADQYDLGIALFSPRRSYNTGDSLVNGQMNAFTVGPNDLDSKNELFFIPHMAGTWKLSETSAWGAAFYGRGGMNTRWEGGTATFDPDGPGPAPVLTLPGTYGGSLTGSGSGGTAGVDFSQAFLDLTYSRKAGENFTWGVSIVGAMQVFAARGVGTFAGFTETFATDIVNGGFGVPVENLSNNGHDKSFGFGGKVGIQWDASDSFAFAASYQSRFNMGKFDKYADLFAEHGGFDIPPAFKAGITFRPNDGLAFSLDVEKIWYGDIDSVANPVRNVYACPTALQGGTDLSSCFGGNNAGGFGWEDMTILKLGVQWTSGNNWTWRAGISEGDQPIPDRETLFNILAPGVMETHLTFGFTRELTSGDEFNMAFMYAPNNKVSGPGSFLDSSNSGNPFDPTQTVTINMDQWEIEFSYGWR